MKEGLHRNYQIHGYVLFISRPLYEIFEHSNCPGVVSQHRGIKGCFDLLGL